MTCYTMGKFPDFALLLPESGGQNIFDINLNSLLGGPFQLPRVIIKRVGDSWLMTLGNQLASQLHEGTSRMRASQPCEGLG